MIRIHKPAAPVVLRTKGRKKRGVHCSLFSRFADDYRTGTKKFDFDSGIYGHKSVKQALIDAQHKKCAFCESKITHVSYGDVEHFRPKGGVRQTASDALAVPGYYWLAYEWGNLLLSCQLCNQRHKRNLFPLANPGVRAATHHHDLSREEPLFINPAAGDDPAQYISFRCEVPYAVNGNARGRATISALGLDREDLNEMRRGRLAALRILQDVVQLGQDPDRADDPEFQALAAEARAELLEAGTDSAEYAGMVQANFLS